MIQRGPNHGRLSFKRKVTAGVQSGPVVHIYRINASEFQSTYGAVGTILSSNIFSLKSFIDTLSFR